MTKANEARRRQIAQYVSKTLQLNPVEQSGEIIRRRSRLLGLEVEQAKSPAKNAPATIDPRAQRQALTEKIESIRSTFWTLRPDQLQEALRDVKAQEFPDLQDAVTRLSTVAKYRDRLPHLTNQKGYDPGFFRVFRDVLIASPRESAIPREKMLAQCGKRNVRKRATKMISLIRREIPALYELEADWLESLTRQKNSSVAVANKTEENWSNESGGDIPWWVWIVGIAILRAVFKAMSSGD